MQRAPSPQPARGRPMFEDRAEAGRLLAQALQPLELREVVVLALSRGGVPVALEVAHALQARLDLLLVRKIGAPGQPELAIAAVAEGRPPTLVVHRESLLTCGADRDHIEREASAQLQEIERHRAVYLPGRAPLPVEGRTAVVVDDGVATATTLQAALEALRRRKPARLVLAMPVASSQALAQLGGEVDELVCLRRPTHFHAVGAHYRDFRPVEDREVMAALRTAAAEQEGTSLNQAQASGPVQGAAPASVGAARRSAAHSSAKPSA